MKGLKVFCVWVLAIAVTVVDGQSRIAYLKTRNRDVPAVVEDLSAKKSMELPIEKIGELWLVRANLDGEEGNFILDTGAPSLVINQSNIRGDFSAYGTTGNVKVDDTTVSQFSLSTAQWKNHNALALDLRHFERSLGTKLMGIIGYDILKRFELTIAPEQKIMYLSVNESIYRKEAGITSVNMSIEGHLPVVDVEINHQVFRFGIDTGAEVNMINPEALEKLAINSISEGGHVTAIGLGKKSIRQRIIQIESMNLGQHLFEEIPFAVLKSPVLNEASGIDGILGNQFLNKIVYSMNYRKGVLQFFVH
jgi:predicted aspartyl protease